MLAIDNRDARPLRLRDRRSLLQQIAEGWEPPLNLSPVTTDCGQAQQWFEQYPAAGIEGLVIKGAGERYEGGKRQWVKVKHRDTLDVICGAVIGPRELPQELVIGLPVDGELRIAGRSTPLRSGTARTLGKQLRPPRREHPWPEQVRPGALDRFNKSGRDLIDLTLIEPIVVEISADVAWTGHSFRHLVRFLRSRPELHPVDVELPDR